MLKALDDYGIIQLTHLLNIIYDTGYLPSDLLESVFITLPKKPKATECGEFRTISLMSHIMKLLLKIILKRNQVLLNENSGETQFGFMSGSGTHDAILMRKVFTSRKISLATKLRLVKCYVYSSLLYCCETWTLYLNDTKRLAAFEMWIYRRLGRIPWTEKRTNQYVLNHLNVTKSLMKDIKSRKLKYFGHVKRHQNILKSVLEGVTEGRRCRGRQRSVWCDNI